MSGPVELARDDLHAYLGETLGPSASLTIDQAMVDRFAALTGDDQWVHVDTARAEREIGGTLVHGYFTLSLVPRFVAQLLRISGVRHALNYGSARVRYPAPLRTGQAIEARLRLMAVTRRGEGQLVQMEVTITPCGGASPVCVAETLTLLYPGDGQLG